MKYVLCADQVERYVRQFGLAVAPLLLLLLHFHLNDVGFAYANANTDAYVAYSDVDASP